MKTFKDLRFRRRIIEGTGGYNDDKQAIMRFSNDYGISVIGGGVGQYGDGVRTFELAVLVFNDEKYDDCDGWPSSSFNLCYNTPITDDILGYQNKRQITKVMLEVQKLEAPINIKCSKIFENINNASLAQLGERVHGKNEVFGSIPKGSSI